MNSSASRSSSSSSSDSQYSSVSKSILGPVFGEDVLLGGAAAYVFGRTACYVFLIERLLLAELILGAAGAGFPKSMPATLSTGCLRRSIGGPEVD